MKKALVSAVAVLMWCARCAAQTPSPPAGPPPGPWILRNAGEFARWVIDYRYTDAPTRPSTRAANLQNIKRAASADPAYAKMLAGNPGMMLALDPPRPQQTLVVKTKNLKEQKITYEGGLTGECWSDGLVDMTLLPGMKTITVDFSRGDPSAADFEEFGWLTRQNFQGSAKVEDHDCLIFQESAPALSITNPKLYANLQSSDPHDDRLKTKVPITATVDAESKRPVLLQVGDEIHHYTFLPAGTEMLVMPPEFTEAARQTEAEYRETHKPHAPP